MLRCWGSCLIGLVVWGCGGGGVGLCSALTGGELGVVTAGCAIGIVEVCQSTKIEHQEAWRGIHRHPGSLSYLTLPFCPFSTNFLLC